MTNLPRRPRTTRSWLMIVNGAVAVFILSIRLGGSELAGYAPFLFIAWALFTWALFLLTQTTPPVDPCPVADVDERPRGPARGLPPRWRAKREEPAPVVPRGRFSLRMLMAWTAVVAVCLAGLGVLNGGVLSAAILIVAATPTGYRLWSLELTATAAWLVGAAHTFSNPTNELGGAGILYAFGAFLMLIWSVRLMSQSILISIQVKKSLSRGYVVMLLIFPVSFFLVFHWLVHSNRDFDLRLRLSEPALRMDALGGPAEWNRPRWVGLFWVEKVEQEGNCTLWTTGREFDEPGGLAYCPGGVPSSTASETFSHLRGPWWHFRKWHFRKSR